MAQNKIDNVRDHLFMQLERLNDDTLTPEQMEIEIEKAKAVSQVAATLIQTAKVEIDFINAMGVAESQSPFFSSIINKQLL